VLARDYPLDHQAIIYKAATLPTGRPSIQNVTLAALPAADIDMHATLVIPPHTAFEPDQEIRQRLDALDSA